MKKFNQIISFIKEKKIYTLILGAIFFVCLFINLMNKDTPQKDIGPTTITQSNFSGGKIIENESNIYQKKDRLIANKMEQLEKKIEYLTEKLEEVPEKEPEVETEAEQEKVLEKEEDNSEEYTYQRPVSRPIVYQEPVATAPIPNIISFPVKSKTDEGNLDHFTVSLPSGSFVKAKLLTGVEAPEGKSLPVLLQADFAFVGPNKSKIDLSGCFLLAKSMGNLSIERVEMQVTKLSCVGRSGKMFERSINGFVADDKDNSFAIMGKVNSKQNRVAAMAFLSSIVEGISSAVGKAQMTSVTSGLGGTTQMITGSQAKFIAAEGAGSAASTITEWYLKHAQGLMPTINIGSGADVWIVLQDMVKLPNWYFRKIQSGKGEMSFLTKLVE